MTDHVTPRSTVPIADPDVGGAELERIGEVLRSGALSGGDEVAAFGA